MPTPIDPWEFARSQQRPDTVLMRCIYPEHNVQFFLEIPSSGDVMLYDGATYFPRDDYTIDQRDQLKRAADKAWQSDHERASA